MIADLKPYPSMKRSGVSWLGEVPAHWEVLPALAVYKPRQVKNTGMVETTVLSLSYGRIIVKPPEKLRGLVPQSFETYQVVDPGNIIVRTTDLQNDQTSLRIGRARHRGIITSAYMCLETTSRVSNEFGYQYLNAYDRLKIIYGFGSGLRQNLDFSDIKRMPVLVPPREEQTAIVRFLDHADRRIRRYIGAKQKLIRLLEEEKQAIVHRTVTRGLDHKVRLKLSGVEWLGDVPEHWAIKKLRHCALIRGGMTPSMETRRYWGGNMPWITPKDMKQFSLGDSSVRVTQDAIRETALKVVPAPAVLMVVRGMILARRVPIAWTTVPVTVNQDMKALLPTEEVSAQFLATFLSAAQAAFVPLIDEAGHGTRRLPTERWRDLCVALPPPTEQAEILRRLDEETAALDRAVAAETKEISLLREYRTRLIADVVTGKLDVREAAPRLPAEVEEPESLDEAVAETDGDEGEADDVEDVTEETGA